MMLAHSACLVNHFQVEQSRPLIVSVNLTTACNLACTYCEAIHRRDNLAPGAIEQLAKGLGRLGERAQLVPFGGEPLVAYRALCRLIEAAEANGVRESLMCTNGLLLDDARLDYLTAHHVEITISYDGVAGGEQVRVHADGRGAAGDIEAMLERLGGRADRQVQVRITVAPATAERFSASVDRVLELLGHGPGVKICFMPVSTLPWPDDALAALERGVAEAAAQVVSRVKSGQRVAIAYNECLRSHELGHELLFDEQPAGRGCLWGVKMLGVDTDGGLYPCHTVIELRREQRAHLAMGHVERGLPALAAREAMMPPRALNPHHCCFAFNLARSGDPYDVAEVYRRLFRACLDASVAMVEALSPGRARCARERAAALLAESVAAEQRLSSSPRPSPAAG